jgi:hypothetical protein
MSEWNHFDDNTYYRVILRPEQRHTVLDAHRVGDIFFNFTGDQTIADKS